MQHDPKLHDNPEFQAQWRHWRGEFRETFRSMYEAFDALAARGAEAREYEEGGLWEEFSEPLVGSLPLVQEHPERLVQYLHSLYIAGLHTILKVLQAHWRESEP